MRLNHRPLVVFILFLFAFFVAANPRLFFKKGNQNQRDVGDISKLVSDRSRETLHMVSDEADDAEALHGTPEFNLSEVSFQVLFGRHVDQLHWIVFVHKAQFESFLSHFVHFLSHPHKLAVAVVDQLNNGVLASLCSCAVVHEQFKQVAN